LARKEDVDALHHRRAKATPFFERLWPGMTNAEFLLTLFFDINA
jgi:hypothetical protein